MRKIYEATDKTKEDIIDIENDYRAFNKQRIDKDSIGIEDMVMIGKLNDEQLNSYVDIHWSLNGINIKENSNNSIIVIEPFSEQVKNEKLANISENDTYFSEPIKLSKKSILLIPIEKYDELIKNSKIKKRLDKLNVRLYEGEEKIALKMLLFDKRYIYVDMTDEGYYFNEKEHPDVIKYQKVLIESQKQIVEILQEQGQNVTYKKSGNIKTSNQIINYDEDEIEEVPQIDENELNKNYKMITGITKKVEGNAELDDELYATTDIGKSRDNQEDALLLIKDKENPDFKMLVVADGMGGWQKGEIASNIVVEELKKWFENLNKEEKNIYYNSVETLKESLLEIIEVHIQSEVQYQTLYNGGTTLVCAIVGKNDTLIANVGDSRAYIITNGKLEQISREDTVAEENLKNGKTPSKEASRFDKDSNQLLQCIGMNRNDLMRPHTRILNNKDYEMILLFSDGVTDCLSEEDIAVVCKNTNRKEITTKIVEKAIKHDSLEPEELIENYNHLNLYIPGGKDNTTAAAYIPKKKIEKENDER